VSFGATQGWLQIVLNPFALDPADPRTIQLYAPAKLEGRCCGSWRELPALRRWLTDRLFAFQPDIVHVHLPQASALVASIRRPSGARLVLSHQHGDHFRVVGSKRGELLDRLAGRRFDRVVGCSRYVADWLVTNYHYSTARVSVIHNGWSGQPFPRQVEPNARRVLCVAQLRAQKNHRMLIDAVARVRKTVPGARLQLVGDGAERGALESYVRRAGLDSTVEFVGAVDDPWPFLARANVFAVSSLYEPLGIAVLEAMAAGVPVVATDVGGLREIVRSGVDGFLVSPDDNAGLAGRMESLLVNHTLADRMGAEGRRHAASYTSARTCERYAQLYERLLDNGRV
jgi:glycosyltransferase involved in cell wall biosynthesis